MQRFLKPLVAMIIIDDKIATNDFKIVANIYLNIVATNDPIQS